MHKKKLTLCVKTIRIFRTTRFFFEIPDTEACDNQKKLFDHLQFSFDSHADNYRPQRVDKRNQSNGDIFEFCNRHKVFLYKKIESFVIEKPKHDVQIMKTFVEINQFYKIKILHTE